MQTLEAEKEAALASELQRPEFGPGDVIELKLSVPENRRRVTVFKGICIAKRNRRWALPAAPTHALHRCLLPASRGECRRLRTPAAACAQRARQPAEGDAS